MDESKEESAAGRSISAMDGVMPRLLFAVENVACASDAEFAARAAVRAGFDGVHWTLPGDMRGGPPNEINGKSCISQGRQWARDAALAVSIPWQFGDSSLAPTLGPWIEWAVGADIRLLHLNNGEAETARRDAVPRWRAAEVENRLFDLLVAHRFAAEAAGVEIAVSPTGTGDAPGAPALRELLDAVASSAIGACATVRPFDGEPAWGAAVSILGYRIKMLDWDVSPRSTAESRGPGEGPSGGTNTTIHESSDHAEGWHGLAKPDPVRWEGDTRPTGIVAGLVKRGTGLREAFAQVGGRSTVVVRGEADPATALAAVSRHWESVCPPD